MLVNTEFRSNAAEIMDDFSMQGETLKDALDKIASINRLLGGNKLTIQGLEYLLSAKRSIAEINVLDVGCGNGDMLRTLAAYGLKKGIRFKLTGIDANAFTIKHAEQLSKEYPNISYRCADIFEEIKQERSYDVILCTLTLHHFQDQEILTLIQGFKKSAKMGIVVNDLHRSKVAYYLFAVICFLFRLNTLSRKDGLVSILRGFKLHDLMSYSDALGIEKYSLRWKWAFRYQWIIPTA